MQKIVITEIQGAFAVFISTDQKMLRVSIEFSLERPQGGIHFVVPDTEGSMAEVRNWFSFAQHGQKCTLSNNIL